MAEIAISQELQNYLTRYCTENKHASLIPTYLYFVEKKFNLEPVLFLRDKIIFQSLAQAISLLEKEGKIARETEIKIGYVISDVDENTKKIYICPFTGKVFGDNTNPNPQDAIYEWVSHCKENTERIGGVKVKRFFISEDPQVIASYRAKSKPKEPITKVVYSSAINGKLFHSRDNVIEDMKANYIKSMTLLEVQNQNKYTIEKSFMEFIEQQLSNEKITSFVEALATIPFFGPHIERWLKEAT